MDGTALAQLGRVPQAEEPGPAAGTAQPHLVTLDSVDIVDILIFYLDSINYIDMQTCITSTEWEVELSATAVIIEDDDDDDDEDSVMPCEERMMRDTVTRDWDMAPSVPSLASAGHRAHIRSFHTVNVHILGQLSVLRSSALRWPPLATGSPCQLRCGPGL